MNRKHRVLILGTALGLHVLALGAFDASMVQARIGQLLAQAQAERIVVVGPSLARRTLATQSCPAPRG